MELRETDTPLVEVEPYAPTDAEKAEDLFQESLKRSEELLIQGRAREAVQESLWLLETSSTAFRGMDTETGTIEGKYFNQIIKELKRILSGKTFEKILVWLSSLHGYLSSPTGGGVRHGLDLKSGLELTPNEARLFCNLIRSYLSYMLAEHKRLGRGR